jgi:signal recognition particle GTPase
MLLKGRGSVSDYATTRDELIALLEQAGMEHAAVTDAGLPTCDILEHMADAVMIYLSDVRRAAVLDTLRTIAAQYPADVFTDQGQTGDGIAGTAIRTRMQAEIRALGGES